MIKCNTCANLIPNDSEFCPFCGNKVIHIVEEPLVQGDSLLSIQPDVLIKRAFLFLEEGDFEKANNYIEAALNQEPENAEAYLAKLLMDLRVSTVEELSNVSEPFDNNINYKRALRYGDEMLKEKILMFHNNCLNSIAQKEDERLNNVYSEAMELMLADTEDDYKNAVVLFESILNYRDSAELVKKCLIRLDEFEKDSMYEEACSLMESNGIYRCKKAIELFQKIPNWKDSTEKISLCNKKIDELNKELEKDRKKEILIAISFLGVILLVVVVAIICDSIYY